MIMNFSNRDLCDLLDEELADIYCQYIDTASTALVNGFIDECARRGLSLTDLEDHCSK